MQQRKGGAVLLGTCGSLPMRGPAAALDRCTLAGSSALPRAVQAGAGPLKQNVFGKHLESSSAGYA